MESSDIGGGGGGGGGGIKDTLFPQSVFSLPIALDGGNLHVCKSQCTWSPSSGARQFCPLFAPKRLQRAWAASGNRDHFRTVGRRAAALDAAPIDPDSLRTSEGRSHVGPGSNAHLRPLLLVRVVLGPGPRTGSPLHICSSCQASPIRPGLLILKGPFCLSSHRFSNAHADQHM